MIYNREKTEWVRYMWQNANDDKKKRILLIGDSITEGIYPDVCQLLDKYFAVDLLASSRVVSDPVFDMDLEAALVDYRREMIYFNNGLHNLDVPINIFEEAFFDKVDMLLHYAPKLVLATCTPITEQGQPHKLSVYNNVVLERNEVIRTVAKKYHLPLNDWYDFISSCPFYKLNDGYHYTEEGKRIQAKIVCDMTTKLT